VATGGTVEDGLYVLQAAVFYGSAPCPSDVPVTGSIAWAVCGDQWATVQQAFYPAPDGSVPLLFRQNLTKTVTGSTLHEAFWCATDIPGAFMETKQYSATPGHLSIFTPFCEGIMVTSYTRQ
jgi:hypothetical protein